MISFFETSITSLSVHRVGNKLMDEGCSISPSPVTITEETAVYLMSFFLSPFQKENNVFRFFSHGALSSNPVYSSVRDIFTQQDSDHEQSKNIARHLYDSTNHPKIKGGELYVARFKNIQYQGELFEAVGIFKSESKETYLKVNQASNGFDVRFEQDAINLSQPSKGCLIINSMADDGFRVFALNEKQKDISYWKDEFLSLQVFNNDYYRTNTLISTFKSFVLSKLDDEFEISRADKIDLLNKSVKYFKEKETFDRDEFSHEVIGSEQAIDVFTKYLDQYQEEFETEIPENFDISTAAVKKHVRSLRGILKLDTNFQIVITGNKQLVERGYDADKEMNFYKLYYKEEA